MFSGIVEAQSKIIHHQSENQTIRIQLQRPISFADIQIGDSICVNGVCLTIEKFDTHMMQFCLGTETLKILGNTFENWKEQPVNLERSLAFGSRVHGHLVTGHVDARAEILESFAQGDCWQIVVHVPDSLRLFFWKKGSVCLNGVSLTVNQYENGKLSVCLIPETIKATNLALFAVGTYLNIEADYLAKAYILSKAGGMHDQPGL